MSDTSTTAPPAEPPVPVDEISRLAGLLSSDDVTERQQARQSLVRFGSDAVPALLPLLSSGNRRERWEAARTLLPIGDPAATRALIATFLLDDENLRWVAGEALVSIGKPAVEACLSSIINRVNEGFMRQGMHHVMHELSGTSWGRFLHPVWEALDCEAWSMAGPLAATQALNEWRDGQSCC